MVIRIMSIDRDGSNIVLIGFMGCGKSSVSRLMKDKYGMETVEMDQVIEQQEGMSISDIFRIHGEEYFRDAETKLLVDLQQKKNVIISCGGGAPLRPENVIEMKRNGTVYLLTAKPETIFHRVRNSHSRPLLEQNKTVDHIAGLMAQRRDKYAAAADVVIHTDNRSISEICDEIMKRSGSWNRNC